MLGQGQRDSAAARPQIKYPAGEMRRNPRQREIASQGGKAAHEKGTAHEFTPEEAREAGSKGGKAAHQKGTAHEFDSEEAREAGRKGGQASGGGQGGGPQGSPPSNEQGGSL